MSACLVVLGALIGCLPGGGPPLPAHGPALRADPADRWVAEDKLQHLAASFAATSMGYGASRALAEPGPARIAAGAGAAALGLAKEIVDARAGGPFSFRDLVWDAAGIALGLTLAHAID